MTLVILWCLATTPVALCTPDTAIAEETRPPKALECAMPWQAQADAREGLYLIVKCQHGSSS